MGVVSPTSSTVLLGAGDALSPGYAHAPHTVEAERQAYATLDASLGVAPR